MDPVDLLVFGPHPDDIEIGFGGSVAVHVAQGLGVGLVDLTRGELGSNGMPEQREAEAEARASLPKLTLHLMDISFDAIKDPAQRDRLMNMPTSFVLPAQDVDLLREAAGRLLRESEDYRSLLRDLGGAPPK